jgi:hypothetical protein
LLIVERFFGDDGHALRHVAQRYRVLGGGQQFWFVRVPGIGIDGNLGQCLRDLLGQRIWLARNEIWLGSYGFI